MSEIGNKRILMALGSLLGIRDVKQAPSELDTTSVKVVAGLDPGMIGKNQIQLIGSVGIGGLGVADWQAIGSDGSFTTPAGLNNALACWRANGYSEAVIIGLRVSVEMQAAALAAEAGAMLRLIEYRQAENDPVSVVDLGLVERTINLTENVYQWTYPFWHPLQWTGAAPQTAAPGPMQAAMGPIYVPSGSRWGIRLSYWESDLSSLRAWPLDTMLTVYGSIVSCPKGMRPPGM